VHFIAEADGVIEGQRRMDQSSLASRVLVIDDEAAVRASVCGILSDVGYIVAEAGDGVAGVDSLRSSAADAVVMDIYMPLRDGFETIRELRRVAPQVRIIAISGGTRGDFDPLKAAEMLGADRALRKPFAMEDLLAALDDVLAGAPPLQQ
jgi:two-component system, chemotaxis family, chemotaxis protein CheY